MEEKNEIKPELTDNTVNDEIIIENPVSDEPEQTTSGQKDPEEQPKEKESKQDSEENTRVDYARVIKELWRHKKAFFITLPIAFVLACVWILPQPRYYTCEVSLAPEGNIQASGGGISDLAASFGVNINSGGSDAIYPSLYPDLFESSDFLVDLLKIQIRFTDDNGKEISTDYYTYLTKYQKKNKLTEPVKQWFSSMAKKFSDDNDEGNYAGDVNKLDPAHLSKKDYRLVEKLSELITCDVDKKTDVVTISVTDQNANVGVILADSANVRLQEFITEYRTSKARHDVVYYQKLTSEAQTTYEKARRLYGSYSDENIDLTLPSMQGKMEDLENDMQLKYNTYTAMSQQLQAAKAKLQENTPVFTMLKNASAPVKPSGPKRMIFVAVVLFFTFLGTSFWVLRKILL